MQVYVHGGMSVATGHGCLNDLWVFDMASRRWTQMAVSTVSTSASSKLAKARVTSVSACQHTLAVDVAGTLLLFGGNTRGADLNKKMQALVPLVSNIPGGPPSKFPAVTRVRPAGTLAALAFCRWVFLPNLCISHCLGTSWHACCSARAALFLHICSLRMRVNLVSYIGLTASLACHAVGHSLPAPSTTANAVKNPLRMHVRLCFDACCLLCRWGQGEEVSMCVQVSSGAGGDASRRLQRCHLCHVP